MSRMLRQQAWPQVKYSVTRLGGGTMPNGQSYPGGLDLATPSLALQPGALRDCLNFEVSQSGGYSRIAGYERYDGQKRPSAAAFIIVQVASFTNVPATSQTLTQAVSGATGTICTVNNVPGAYYMALTQVSGTFDSTHSVSVGATAIGTPVSQTASIDAQTNAQITAAAADIYRALIGAVPGSGNVLDVFHLNNAGTDVVYAFRANAGGTALNLYKSSASGWVQVPFYNLVTFSAGTGVAASPADAATLTQGGVTATIQRVVWASGSWAVAGGTAAGTFVVTNPSGGNFAAGAATVTGGATVTLAGIQTAITMLPGGTFEHVKCNFSGQLVTRRVYGCDGVNQIWEFDGTTLVPIATGLSPDAPSHITFHKNFLFVSQASYLQYCGAGTPYKWSATDGGGGIATGDIVNALLTLPGSQSTATLAVFLATNTAFLYGTDPTTFNYVTFNQGIGAIPRSVQNLWDTVAFDNLGVIDIKTTLNWGNFLPSTLTKNILSFILTERSKLTCSSISRDRSQYRAFFSDGYGLWLTMLNQQYLGAAVVQFPAAVACVDNDSDSSGGELTYFGSSDGTGYVYQMDMGTSFDGASLDARMTLAWDAIKSPRILKRWRAASIEVQGTAYAAISFGYQLGYGSSNIGTPSTVMSPTSFAPAPTWDVFTWDEFFWDGNTLQPTDVDMTGTGENVQVTISSTSNYIAPYTVNSVIYHWTPRRGMRV